MKYTISFYGREAGAIGTFNHFIKDVDAPNAQAALMKLYDTHEHITPLSIWDGEKNLLDPNTETEAPNG